jgi:hypothetical protein
MPGSEERESGVHDTTAISVEKHTLACRWPRAVPGMYWPAAFSLSNDILHEFVNYRQDPKIK